MMKKTFWLMTGMLLPALAASPALAGLSVGDPAPKWHVDEWVKGKPISLDDAKGRITVVEFWATWCGPCVESIPHLTELQKQYADKGVTIIGFTDEDPDNALDKVKEFVGKQGDKIGYAIAFEKGDKTNEAYMKAADQMGIPTAFVIEKGGRIAWIGHPMSGLDEVLQQLTEGTYDLELATKVFPLERKMQEASWAGEPEEAIRYADEIIALDSTRIDAWTRKLWFLSIDEATADKAVELGEEIAKRFRDNATALTAVADSLLEGSDKAKALALRAAERATELSPDDLGVRITYFLVLAAADQPDKAIAWAGETVKKFKGDAGKLARFAWVLAHSDFAERCSDVALRAVEMALEVEPENAAHLMTKFEIQAYCKKDVKAARATGQYLIEKGGDDASLLNAFAWELLTDEEAGGRFNELALAAAQRCHTISGGNNWMYLDTLALAKFENGQAKEAIALEKKAIELCPNDSAKADLQEALARFEGGVKE